MEQTIYTQLLLIVIVPLLIAAIVYSFSLNKRHLELRGKYDLLRQDFNKLESTCEELHNKIALSLSFSESLKQAEVTTNLQAPRIKHSAPVKPQQNDQQKYQHLQTLSASGMATSEIASILAISNYEAEQMLSLARIANKN